ncbi:UDP-galactopyranose mutase [Lachnospiraceae bacterium XBB1006]|nr:UDP-galactopyranose mutase [Lachnospiraceae bacterium XBB1006]
MKDVIIIGSGVAGTVAARKLAEESQKKVLVLERRPHIGGNCFDKKDEHGIWIHVYGPHIFHTNDEEVFSYFSRFTDWYEFPHKVVAQVGEQQIPIPFNLNTLHMVYEKTKAEEMEKKLIETYGEGSRVPIMKLRENPDPQIQEIAEYVYQNVFLRYTMKQWGQTPEQISPEVTGRVPVLISHDNRYFQDAHQGVPKEGFTRMMEKMLQHENIEVRTGVDGREVLTFAEDGTILFEGKPFAGEVIYTGAVDELLDWKYGQLPYRSLDFRFEYHKIDDYQGHAVVNYTVSEDFTRITEFKHLTGQKDVIGTTIVKEYPFAYEGKEGQIPYYAIMNEKNNALYETYVEDMKKYSNLHLLGRLAEYKYYNIDLMARKAMDLAAKIGGER